MEQPFFDIFDNQTSEHQTPIYFLDLTVKNVRCFGEQQTLDLSDGNGKPARWTIILGDNGVGKTTLLKCLVALRPKKNSTIPEGYDWKYLSTFRFSRTLDQDFLVKTSKFYIGAFNLNNSLFIDGYYFGNHTNKGLPATKTKNLMIYAYGASRRMGSGSLEKSYQPDSAANLFEEEIGLINAVEWLLQAIFASQNSQGDSKIYFENRYKKVKNMLIELLPDVTDIRAKPITKTQSNPLIEFKTGYGWVRMRDLSLGYQTLIAWMVDLAHRLFERYSDCQNPLEQPAIVLVDEIDLHLHPKWQRTVITHLTGIFKQTQFIVTAHSPLIVQSAPIDANIVLLKRQGDQVIIHNNQDEQLIKGWRIDQVLTSDLFDVPNARPSLYDQYLKRQQELLQKPQLTDADESELEQIGKKLDELPIVAQTKEDSEAMTILRKAADILKTNYKL